MRLTRPLVFVSALLVACGGRARDKPGVSDGGNRSGGDSERGGSSSGGSGSSSNAGRSATGGAGSVLGQWSLPQVPEETWQSPLEGLCAPKLDVYPWSLWGEGETLYVATVDDDNQSTLRANSGARWEIVPTAGLRFSHVSGVPGGPRLLFGGPSCGVFTLAGAESACISALPDIFQVASAGAERTFALTANRLLHFNGEYLTPFGAPLPEPTSSWPGYELWVGDEAVVVAGLAGKVWVLDVPGERRELSIPDALDARSVWATGENDIWVGAESGRVAHYDGVAWKLFQTGNCAPVTSLWGAKDTLFLAGGGFFGRIEREKLTVIFNQPCFEIPSRPGSWETIRFGPLWGTSATSVFSVVEQERYVQTLTDDRLESSVGHPACGMRRLYWFDGSAFGPL